MMRSIIRNTWVIPLLALATVVARSADVTPATSPATAPALSVWDGIYSSEQLARGQTQYNSACARCHGDNLLGNDSAPALVDTEFLDHWNGKTLGALVDLTWKKMPSDGPGRLNRKQSTDVTAYLLHENGFPVGKSDLTSDAGVLNAIIIKAKK
jgi:mono/diheme cytochrome c family protein